MTLAILHINTCSTEPSLMHTAICTQNKYAGLLDFIFTFNQGKLDLLQIQIDDNYRGRYEGCHMWTELL